jgi:beta-glucanase (GH16 family)
MAAAQPDKPYNGAAIISKERFEYGRYEVRMKSASGSGIVSAIFLRSSQKSAEGTLVHELDFEFMGKADRLLHLACHEGVDNAAKGLRHASTPKNLELPFDPSEDFHTYALEFTPEGIVWFADDVEIWRLGQNVAEKFAGVAMNVTFNIWCPAAKGWAGALNASALPVSCAIDHASYAPLKEGGMFGAAQMETFDSLDLSRWNKAKWTWGGNLAFMTPENVSVRDGVAVLAVTEN